jgi:putative transposase
VRDINQAVNYKTFRFRVKDATSGKRLAGLGNSVNTIWNHCNAVQIHAAKHNKHWPSYAEFHISTRGVSKLVGLPSQVVQAVCKEYALKRRATQKIKLRWRVSRGSKRSLGWVPFTNQDIKISSRGTVSLRGHQFRIWQHRDLEGRIKYGNFSQDARGRWYCNITCAIEPQTTNRTKVVGIDLGFKTLATAHNAHDLDQGSFYRDLEPRLSEAQRRGRKRQARAIHAKIANRRKDALHKYSRAVVNDAGAVFVGNISSAWQIKSGKGKATFDVSWSTLRNLLKYKCDHAGVAFAEVNENLTTQTCSECKTLSGPKGREGLGVRQWVCGCCGTVHSRDYNAAVNIARLGCETLGLTCPRSSCFQAGEAPPPSLGDCHEPRIRGCIGKR